MKPWAWVRLPHGTVWHMADTFTVGHTTGARTATIYCLSDTLPARPIPPDQPVAPAGIPAGDRACARCTTLLARRIDHYTGLLADLPTTPRSPHG